VLAVLKILREGILKNNFPSCGKGGSSFAIFGLSVGSCELQMCLHLWVDSYFCFFFVVLVNLDEYKNEINNNYKC